MSRLIIIMIALFALGACGGGDDAQEDDPVEFSQFVIDEINLTGANDLPAEVNDITFTFDEDETAFDSLL